MNTTITHEGALHTQFRAAMDWEIIPANETALREALQSVMSALLARRDLGLNARLQNMLLACRLRLRALQNALLRVDATEMPRRCEVRELTADLCAAADLLLHPLGRAVRLEAAETPMEADIAPPAFMWLTLELLCNAARHCHGEEILVQLEAMPPRGRKGASALSLTISCAGALDLPKLHAACARPGSGTAAALRVARQHGAPLLWLARDEDVCAALRLPGATNRAPLYYDLPDYVELLSDPFSPVYTALAPFTGVFGGRAAPRGESYSDFS